MANEKEEHGCLYAMFMLVFVLGTYLFLIGAVVGVITAVVIFILKVFGVIN